jgi:uncharacterized membrane-anchored protein
VLDNLKSTTPFKFNYGIPLNFSMTSVNQFSYGTSFQQQATNNSDLTFTQQCIMHSMVAAYLNLISQLTAIPALCQHVTKVRNFI